LTREDYERVRAALTTVTTRRYNLPVHFPQLWPRDQADGEIPGDVLFLRQRLLPRTAEPWPHDLWEAIVAVMMRELGRSEKMARWRRAFDAALVQALMPALMEAALGSVDAVIARLDALRVVPRGGHAQGDTARPPEVVAFFVRQLTRFLEQESTPAGGYRPDARARCLGYAEDLVARYRTITDVPSDPRGPKFRDDLTAGLRDHVAPATLAKQLGGWLFGVEPRTIERYLGSRPGGNVPIPVGQERPG